jgi:hypothetical protein
MANPRKGTSPAKAKSPGRASPPADPAAARELYLVIENNWPDLHTRQEVPIWLNLLRKQKRGTYDRDKAIKLFMYLVDEGARRYNKDFGDGKGIPSYFNKNTRLEVAKDLRDRFEDEVKAGSITLESLTSNPKHTDKMMGKQGSPGLPF